MKKILLKMSSILFVILGLCTSTFVHAGNNSAEPILANKTVVSEKYYNPSSFPENVNLNDIPLNLENEEFNVFQSKSAVAAADNDSIHLFSTTGKVADMRVYSVAETGNNSSSNISGHAFLSIKNISKKKLYIGDLLVNSGHSVTIGTWGNKNEHRGLWYNLEGYLSHTQNAYASNVTMHVYLTQSLLDTVNKNIKASDKWSLTNNCSSFAAKIWNSVCSDKISAGTPNTPASLASSIKKYKTKCGVNKLVPYDIAVYYGYPSTVSSEFSGFTDGM